MRYKLTLLCISLLMFFMSCVYSYEPKISKYENILVVDAELTNLPGPYKVKLSKSYQYDKKTGNPVSGALIKIIDNTGLEVTLEEETEGIYKTIDNNFQGIVGNSYKLQIKLDEETYESNFEILKEPIPIDQVYWEYNTNAHQGKGIQLYVDTHDPTNSTRYYFWNLEETWKFIVPIDHLEHPEWNVCFDSSKNTSYNIATSANKTRDIIDKHALIFIGEKTNKLFIRYTILVKQLALSEPSYKFFKDLINLNINQGTLFDPNPSSLFGNIRNISNEEIPVLGYFLVAGASEKRIFIDRTELPEEFEPINGFEDCNLVTIFAPIEYEANVAAYPSVDSLLNLGYSIIEEKELKGPFWPVVPSIIEVNLAKASCYNCTLNGEIETPIFWIEKED